MKLDLLILRDKQFLMNQLLKRINSLLSEVIRLFTFFPDIYTTISSAYNNSLIKLEELCKSLI